MNKREQEKIRKIFECRNAICLTIVEHVEGAPHIICLFEIGCIAYNKYTQEDRNNIKSAAIISYAFKNKIRVQSQGTVSLIFGTAVRDKILETFSFSTRTFFLQNLSLFPPSMLQI